MQPGIRSSGVPKPDDTHALEYLHNPPGSGPVRHVRTSQRPRAAPRANKHRLSPNSAVLATVPWRESAGSGLIRAVWSPVVGDV